MLAQFDESSIVVYQAYNPRIGKYAATHGRFGGDFKLSRMTWIKPNFLWMMYRCGWASKPDQEAVLAIRLTLTAFEEILRSAVASTFAASNFRSDEEWKHAIAASAVRLQWDPDHDPSGAPVERRAVQLGLRGAAVERYVNEWIIDIEDITPFVQEQARNAKAPYETLLMPSERVFAVEDPHARAALGLD